MRSSEAYWQVGAVANEARQLLEQGWTLIRADDGRNALALLEAITEAYVADWTNLDDSDGEASGFFQDLGPIWTEALLSVDLSSRERKVWASKVDARQHEIDDYGVEEVFEAAHEAALRGWDDSQLQHVLQGTDIENDSWDGEVSEVTVARLHVLERRGRLQEYLHLARAQGQNEAYVAMLVHLDRTQETVAYGRAHLETANEALTLAKKLYDQNEREQDLQIAEEGLQPPGQSKRLICSLQVCSPISYCFLRATQVYQHSDVGFVLSLRSGKMKILLQAPTPLQYMESGDRYFRHFSIPGVVFDVGSLQNMLELRIVPASEGRFVCCLKDLLDSVIINFLLPGFQLACPYLAFPGRKVHAEQGFCPDRTQILKEPTGLTI